MSVSPRNTRTRTSVAPGGEAAGAGAPPDSIEAASPEVGTDRTRVALEGRGRDRAGRERPTRGVDRDAGTARPIAEGDGAFASDDAMVHGACGCEGCRSGSRRRSSERDTSSFAKPEDDTMTSALIRRSRACRAHFHASSKHPRRPLVDDAVRDRRARVPRAASETGRPRPRRSPRRSRRLPRHRRAPKRRGVFVRGARASHASRPPARTRPRLLRGDVLVLRATEESSPSQTPLATRPAGAEVDLGAVFLDLSRWPPPSGWTNPAPRRAPPPRRRRRAHPGHHGHQRRVQLPRPRLLQLHRREATRRFRSTPQDVRRRHREGAISAAWRADYYQSVLTLRWARG